MTAPAVVRELPPASIEMPAVASLAIRAALAGPTRRGRVLGTSSHSVWLRVGYEVVVLSTRDATRMPNAIEVTFAAGDIALARLKNSWSAVVGGGRIEIDGIVANVARWWDPRPALPPITSRRLAANSARFASEVPGIDSSLLRRAVATWSGPNLLEAAGSLLGAGPGLTPEADDYLAGVLAGLRCLAPGQGHRRATAMLDAASAPLAAMAYARTSTLSASLIRHAIHGDVAEPAGAFLRALSDRGDVASSHARLLTVGHTSGPALAAGVVLSARALAGVAAPAPRKLYAVD